jgi:hypothetical protein
MAERTESNRTLKRDKSGNRRAFSFVRADAKHALKVINSKADQRDSIYKPSY